MKIRNKRVWRLWLSAAVLLLAGACNDDKPEVVNPGGDPGDRFAGAVRDFFLGPEAHDFNSPSFTLAIMAPDGTVIEREGSFLRKNAESHFSLNTGLAEGVYRLLYLEYPITENPELADLEGEFSTTQYGLGSRIEVKDGKITVLDHYDEELDLPGRGTVEEPYEISSYHSLIKLAQIVNSEEKNGLITTETHFRQTGKIDLYQASREVDRRYGWQPIGANSALPFRGSYHGGALSTMIIDRPNSAAVGLFGYVNDAAFFDITLSNSAVSGNFAAAGIVGASLASGKDRGMVTMTGCRVKDSEITGSDESVGVGGLLGVVDMQSRAFLHGCSSEGNTVSCSYNAGGLIGASGLYSSVSFGSCGNTSTVSSDFSGAGGLIGTCDTVQAATSWNTGRIIGAAKYNSSDMKNAGIGAGGLVGGTGAATLTSCHNQGPVKGYAGVGGLVGSGRVKGSDTEAYMYNNVALRYCYNSADINGVECVGGLAGEAQAATYAVYNEGKIEGTRYVAGIAGCTSIAVTHNAINLGEVKGVDYVAGIVGKTQFGSLALNHNYGNVSSTGSHLGGVVALAGNNTMINACGNFGNLTATQKTPIGGIVGEIGDPREWTAMNYAECVIGSMEIFMGFLGPFMACTGHYLEAISHTLEIYLHVAEVLTDSGLLVYDAVSWGMGLESWTEESDLTELSLSLSQEVDAANNEIKREMAAFRGNFLQTVNGFEPTCLSASYVNGINNNLNFYEKEGGDDRFNEKINLLREERQEHLEKIHERDEIIHQCIGGVCIVVGTVATIGGLVLSGGAAAPFVVAGAAASIAGGLNALTKVCMEFEENVVIISQCVNAGSLSAPNGEATGGLVGSLQDNSILRDCLNIGSGPGYGSAFAGHLGDAVMQERLISLADHSTWNDYYYGTDQNKTKDCAVWDPESSDNGAENSWKNKHVYVLRTHEEVTNPETYKKISSSWNIGGDDSLWHIGNESSLSYPVPYWSEMTK